MAGPQTGDRARRRKDREPSPEVSFRDPRVEQAWPRPGVPDHHLRARHPHRRRRPEGEDRGLQRRVRHGRRPQRQDQLRPDAESDHRLRSRDLDPLRASSTLTFAKIRNRGLS